MTRLRSEDIEYILDDLKGYDQQLLDRTGHTLKEIALHAVDLTNDEFERTAKSSTVCVVPLTCGRGVIDGFSAAVSGIISHLGFHSFVAQDSDAAGMAEAFERKSDIVLFADDYRFVAINTHTKYVYDNTKMSAKGFVAGLDLMTGGVRGKNALVIGCGPVGCCAARVLVAMGAMVSVCDINRELASTLQREIMVELKTAIQIDNCRGSAPGEYQCIIDATSSTDVIDAPMITPETYVAVPGVPCGLSSEARRKLSDRYLHDPLQIGVATMVMDACKQRHA